jgi:hypothetical protein
MDTAERRARLGHRHHLVVPAADVVTVANDLVGLHSSDPATPVLAARARVAGFEVGTFEAALYAERTLARVVGMRKTLFVVPVELGDTIRAACATALAEAEQRRLVRMLEDQGVTADGRRWLTRASKKLVEALTDSEPMTAAQMTKRVPKLGQQLQFGAGTAWAAGVPIGSRLLFLLATRGEVVRARPVGSWISGQYRWATTATWFGHSTRSWDPAEAKIELVRRWLAVCGPGTLTDVKWWSGWTVQATKAALAGAGAVEVDLDGTTGYVLAEDLDPTPAPDPWVALLPGLDPTVMAWKERAWFLGPHERRLFDRNGNAGPTVWADGRVVGGWAQRADASVVIELVEDVGADVRATIDAEARRLAAWLAPIRVTPRFRSPFERALAADPVRS